MRFIQKVVGPDKKLIGICTIHWIYGMRGLVWLGFFMLVGTGLDMIMTNLAVHYTSGRGAYLLQTISECVFWICTALGGFVFLFYFLMMIATEIGLTNKSIIIKKGLIFIDVKEVDLEEIKAAEVNNGLFGRIFNYGYLVFDARFIDNVNLPAIADPYRFVKALNEARGNLRNDSMKIILEGGGENLKEKLSELKQEEKQAHKPHKLEEPRYEATETTAAAASRAVIDETRENLEPGPEVKPQKVSDIKKGQGPIVFQKDILKDVIKDNFSATTGS